MSRPTVASLQSAMMDVPDVEGEGPFLVVLMSPTKGISLTRFPTLSDATASALGYTGPKWLFEVGEQHGWWDGNLQPA